MSLRSLVSEIKKTPSKLVWGIIHLAVLAFAVWLVSPFIVIDMNDYANKSSYGLRLAFGLMIFIMYIGKWSFDVFSPQGLARRVSRLKSTALVIYIVIVISFMIFIVAQAASLYLQSAVSEAESNVDQTQSSVQLKENRIPDRFDIDI